MEAPKAINAAVLGWLFRLLFAIPVCLTTEILISVVRRSRLLPKFISAANNIHFNGFLHFYFIKFFLWEGSAANLVAMPLGSGLATAQDQFSRRIAPDRIERSRNGQILV
jgi:hypothetical protein